MNVAIPKFVDHHPGFNPGGYVMTNEEPELFNDLLGNEKFNRTACICSGGEILIGTLMRRSKSVVAIDHSYRALASALNKLMLLQKLPYKELLDKLYNEQYDDIVQHMRELLPGAPEKLRMAVFDRHSWSEVRREWCRARIKGFSKRRIGNVTLVHGDLRDLADNFGTFDLFYASNAMEHSGRDHKSPQFTDVAKILNPGGTLMYTSNYSTPPPDALFDTVKKVRGFRTNWMFFVARKK